MSPPHRPHVVHITTVHTPFDQRIFHRECVSLKNAGYDVSLMACGDIAGTCDGVTLVSLSENKRNKAGLHLLSRWRRMQSALKKAMHLDAAVYHIHDPELIGIGLSLKKTKRAHVIYDCHEDNVAYMLQKKYIPSPFRHILAYIIMHNEMKAVQQFDAIVTADEGMRDHFYKKGATRVVKVDNFPRLDLFLGKKNTAAPIYDLVYHGTIPKHHLETCFAVDSELINRGVKLKWLFVGKCPCLNWAKSVVQKMDGENRFTFKGVVPHDKIADWVLKGRIGIIPLPDYPKFQRNVPTKLFEFMALKMPVVLSDLPPSRPYVGDGKCAIMVKPESPVEYATAIMDLISNPHRRIEMGEEGHKRVVSGFNWENSFNALGQLYEDILCTKS